MLGCPLSFPIGDGAQNALQAGPDKTFWGVQTCIHALKGTSLPPQMHELQANSLKKHVISEAT